MEETYKRSRGWKEYFDIVDGLFAQFSDRIYVFTLVSSHSTNRLWTNWIFLFLSNSYFVFFFSLCSLNKITEEKSEINVTWDGSNHLEFSIKKLTQNLNFKNIKNWIKSKQSIKSGSSVLNFQYYACQLNRYHSVYSSPPH